jgi:glycine oxidase
MIAIAGGGVIGLACALALRSRGHAVTLFEARTAAREASWAAGGMLAADDPENPPELHALSCYSRSLYPAFLNEIEALSGRNVPLRTHQTVQVIGDGHGTAAGTPLSPDEAQRLVPGLGTGLGPCVLLEEHSLDPRDLAAALAAAVRAAGVILREQERVLSAEPEGRGIRLTSDRGTLHANAFVNACGAWATSLDTDAGVAPSKGQMMAVAQPDFDPLTRVLRSPEIYLIPRDRHRVVIGATVEDAGFSKDVQPDALALLRTRAAKLWPPAADAPLLESWAGLRPGTPDTLPVIGRCDAASPRWLAAGHYRNGILLAPATGQVIADLIEGVAPATDLTPFSPHRAAISAVCDKRFAAAL